MKEKIVCFAGHRYDFQNIGIEKTLRDTIISLIKKGYTIFYDGGKGYFDKISAEIVLSLKKEFPEIKIYKILTYYNHNKEELFLPPLYEGFILPDIEEIFPKVKIIKRNEWIVKSSDLVVCHIYNTFKSGAYRMVKFARKINKPIIFI